MKLAERLKRLGEEALTKEAQKEATLIDAEFNHIVQQCEIRAELGGTQYSYGSERMLSHRVPFKYRANLETLKKRLEAEGLEVEYKLPDGDLSWLTGTFIVKWGNNGKKDNSG